MALGQDTQEPPRPDAAPPTVMSVLERLSQERLRDLSRTFGIGLQSRRVTTALMATKMGQQLAGRLPAVLRELGRDELRVICERHGLPASDRGRNGLQARVLEAAGLDPASTIPPPAAPHHDHLPGTGSEGTLGGVVEEGRRLRHHMRET